MPSTVTATTVTSTNAVAAAMMVTSPKKLPPPAVAPPAPAVPTSSKRTSPFANMEFSQLAEEKEDENMNCLRAFWQEALAEPMIATLLASSEHIDKNMYWEKRRIQNHVRRLLEEIQERLGIEMEATPQDLDSFFNKLLHMATKGSLHAARELTEKDLSKLLEGMNLWPMELAAVDRNEVLAALQAPSAGTTKQILRNERPIKNTLTAHTFRAAFEQVPYNLPEFPVPAHMIEKAFLGPYTEAQHQAVAEAIATCWRYPQTGVDRIKDFFCTGLVSIEEIQCGLPRLIPRTLVEDAVALIIRKAAPQFTQQAWDSLVVEMLKSEEELQDQLQKQDEVSICSQAAGRKNSCPVSLDSPKAETREVTGPPSFAGKSREDELSSMEGIGKIPTTVAECLTMKRRVVDWSTAGAKKDGRAQHQADAGAGSRMSWGTACFKEELMSSLKANKADFAPGGPCGDVDPVQTLSLKFHNECEGPYLARAFAHCCEIYDKQRPRR